MKKMTLHHSWRLKRGESEASSTTCLERGVKRHPFLHMASLTPATPEQDTSAASRPDVNKKKHERAALE